MKEEDGGTRLTFTQIGIPAESRDSIADGWRDNYWQPLKGMLEKSSDCPCK
jgi:hypothetical protein